MVKFKKLFHKRHKACTDLVEVKAQRSNNNRMKKTLLHIAVLSWWHLPFSRRSKERVKTFIFSLFPFLFKNSKTYQNWKYTKSLSRPDYSFSPSDFPEHLPVKKVDVERYKKPEAAHSGEKPGIKSLAVVVHVFYVELFEELLDYLRKLPVDNCKLFISTSDEIKPAVERLVADSSFNYHIEAFENRGRDILPFLRLAPKAIREGFDVILKLHTKKSDHRLTGELWRKELYGKLLNPDSVRNISTVLQQCPQVGLFGAAGHIVPMSLYYGGNARLIGYFSYCLGVEPRELKNLFFIAGSMFYIRAGALQPLLDIGIKNEMFEEEKGQQDGTLAHAVERAFALSNYAAGYILADTGCTPQNLKHTITDDHPFTW